MAPPGGKLTTRGMVATDQKRVGKLLIVEEIPALRRLIRSLLEGLELSIDECHDGREMLAACVAKSPDWALLDLNLSDTDALTATKQVKLVNPDTQIVVISETGNLLLREASHATGACHYVLKDNLHENKSPLRRKGVGAASQTEG